MKTTFIGLIRFYHNYISPYMLSRCKFYPSCSAYAIEAIEKKGFFLGLASTLFRILRCHPLSNGGYDPVGPARKLGKGFKFL